MQQMPLRTLHLQNSSIFNVPSLFMVIGITQEYLSLPVILFTSRLFVFFHSHFTHFTPTFLAWPCILPIFFSCIILFTLLYLLLSMDYSNNRIRTRCCWSFHICIDWAETKTVTLNDHFCLGQFLVSGTRLWYSSPVFGILSTVYLKIKVEVRMWDISGICLEELRWWLSISKY